MPRLRTTPVPASDPARAWRLDALRRCEQAREAELAKKQPGRLDVALSLVGYALALGALAVVIAYLLPWAGVGR